MDINPGMMGGSAPSSFTRLGQLMFFIADDGTYGGELFVAVMNIDASQIVEETTVTYS